MSRHSLRAAMLVARREFIERLRSRALLVSNAILLLALLGGITVPALLDRDVVRRVGYTPDARPVAELVAAQARQVGDEVSLVAVSGRPAAEAAVQPPDERDTAPGDVPDERLDAVFVGDNAVLVWEELPADLEPIIDAAVRTAGILSTIDEAQLPASARQALLSPAQADVEVLNPPEEAEEGPALFVGAFAVFVLYGLLIFYGQFVAQGIIEEKSSRVVEILLSAVRPTTLLYGKILGLTALGLAQILLLAVVGVGAAVTFRDVDIPPDTYGTLALAIAWFVLGFVLYATLFAVSASLVSSQEDLQSTVFPVMLPIIVGFFAAQYSLQNPDSTVSLIAGLVPFTAPLVQPLRFGARVVEVWEVPVALALSGATIALLVPLAARFYSGSVLRFGGRVRLGDAWKAAAKS
jgi:ABC-2 type transport system permease protein